MTHLFLGGLTLMLYLIIMVLAPPGKQGELLLIVLGYLSLLLIAVTLLIGPLNLWRRKRARHNPVNLFLRRDVGIWAAITGCWHSLLVLRGYLFNGQISMLILKRINGGYVPLLTVYGLSNDAGLLAALLLLLLLVLSNTLTLRLLKGKRWKQVQRLAYLLAILAVAHTVGFQYLNLRGPLFVGFLLLVSALVLLCQSLGVGITLNRKHRQSL